MKVVVIIPTYNEVENIKLLIPALLKEFVNISQHDLHILVVDGNSPDGTGRVVDELGRENDHIHLLTEKKKAGLGAAYIVGFEHAMNHLQAEVLVEMDADFQHDPKDLSRMFKVFDQGYDYIIGSRFVRGGSIPKQWALYRKFLSLAGSQFSKLVLGVYGVNDFTTGFKISRVRGFVDKIDFRSINSSGFAYKIDLLYKMHLLGARIKEVPIQFGLRDRGDSKMEKDNALDSLRVVMLLRYQKSRSFFRFVSVGFIGLFVDSGLFSLLRVTLVGSSLASALSGLVAMLTTFILNNYWSFGERKLSGFRKKLTSFAVYFGSSYLPIIFRSFLIRYSIGIFGDTALVAYSAFFVGILVGLIWNYTVYSRVIWKKTG